MAFELPQMPNFNPQIPAEPDFMQKYGQMLAMKNMLGQQQKLPLELQAEQQNVQQQGIQTQVMQNKLNSQNAMIKAWSDPGFMKEIAGSGEAPAEGQGPVQPFDPNAMTASLVKRGVLPEDAMALTNQFVDRASKLAEMAKSLGAAGADQVNIYAKAHQQLADLIAPITKMPVGKAGPALEALKQKLLKSPIPGLDQTDAALVNSATLEHLPALVNMLGLSSGVADWATKQAQRQKAEEELPGGALTPEKQAQAEAANPVIQKSKLALSEAEGAARANIEMAVQTQMLKGSDAALKSVPPRLVAAATADATKAGTDFAQAQSVTQRLQAMMQAAKDGNVVSYQLIPQEGALQVTTSQGVHRINMAEIQNYGGGSLWQKMQGHFGKALTGKSIPDSVLNDMSEMQKIQQEGSQAKYENTLKTINQAYGASFKPVEMPTPQVTGKSAAGAMVMMKAPNGQTKSVPADQVEHYKSMGATVQNQ